MGHALAAAISVALVTSSTFDFLGFTTSRGFLFLLIGCAGAFSRLAYQEQQAPVPAAGAGRPVEVRRAGRALTAV